MPDSPDDRRPPPPAHRGASIAAGATLVLIILGLLAALWMPAIIGAKPPNPSGLPAGPAR